MSRDAALIDFLLARIADDERCAHHAPRAEVRGRSPLEPGAPLRTLAECTSRRALVAGCAVLDDTLETYGVAAPFDGGEALRWLALPYAGHPDFDADWLPITAPHAEVALSA